MSKKLLQNATSSSRGIVYQFYIVLDKANDLIKGQSIFVEKYGDVTITGNKLVDFSNDNLQIESKNYKKALTDMHTNFWNTLRNWARSDFKHDNYCWLILFTTQKIGLKSKFIGWNDKSGNDKYEILKEIKNENTGSTSKVNRIINEIFSNTSEETIKAILNKYIIVDSSPCLPEYYQTLKDKIAKNIPEPSKDDYMSALLGFLLTPETVENNKWEITYENYSSRCERLAEEFCSRTKIFPVTYFQQKPSKEGKVQFSEYLFVKKIKDIEYDVVVSEAITQYWQTMMTIGDDFKKRNFPKTHIDVFQTELVNRYGPKYRKASRNATDAEIVKDSQDFYDDIMGEKPPTLANFNDTPIFFKNGMYHALADDESKNILWKLERKNEQGN